MAGANEGLSQIILDPFRSALQRENDYLFRQGHPKEFNVGTSYTGGYGRVYRIPVQREGALIGDYTYRDVTKKEAKAHVKRVEKHARAIRKALA